jgi:hypothetical protein
MTTYAGQMVAGAPTAEWLQCNGQTIQPRAVWGHGGIGAGLNPMDYYRRVGRHSGALNWPGWRVRLPLNPTWTVSMADNTSAATGGGPYTAVNPPPGTR